MRVRIEATIGGTDADAHRRSIQALLSCSQLLSQGWLRAHPEAPNLYSSGVRYRREPPELREQFATAPVCLLQGWGDCDDLAPWRAAELVVREGEPGARAIVYEVAPGSWHCVVRRADGSIECPSSLLGMRPTIDEFNAARRLFQ